MRFARHARRKPLSPPHYVPDIIVEGPHVYRPARPAAGATDIFTPDMLYGESKELFARRMKSVGQGMCQKAYSFDVRNDDGRAHFRRISRRYPELYLVLVCCDQNIGEYGSYLIRDGRSRWHLVPEDVIESTMLKHGWDPDLYPDADEEWRDEHWENETAYIDASFDLMDQCEARWVNLVHKRLGIHSSAKR